MNQVDWTRVSAISDVFGTVAVVVSLIFVGLSIRQNTGVVQASNDNVIYELADDWFSEMINNPNLNEIYEKRRQGDSLTQIEIAHWWSQTTRAMNAWELAYSRAQNGLLPPEQWDMWHRANAVWLIRYVPLEDWQRARSTYAWPFADYIDSIYVEN